MIHETEIKRLESELHHLGGLTQDLIAQLNHHKTEKMKKDISAMGIKTKDSLRVKNVRSTYNSDICGLGTAEVRYIGIDRWDTGTPFIVVEYKRRGTDWIRAKVYSVDHIEKIGRSRS